ncbi:S8 family peptidase [Halopiger xanaduensis]|uniref:Thermitase n=1 Tax=Halopiger xanaduensis (strain DSM 18323 / JCM 14033 / SH-6) TaxID=797210 RepID=F8D709_HALXS|nr:S8 family serine peptidase [Halopiger xanaduensis]AEH35438.1 Thermitase [Halopiger xanaduensis SH-6]
MQPNDPRDGADSDRAYDRRTILTGAGSLSIGGLLASSGLVSADDENGREPGPKEDELIVGISPSASDIEREALAAVPGDARVEHTNDVINYVVVSFPSEAPDFARETFIESITANEFVEYAEPNATMESFVTPNDPYYGSQHAPGQVGCDEAWETTYGDGDVTISIVDQGIQYDHPALADNMDDSVSNHGDVFTGYGSDPYPVAGDEQHGTHVGGIAAGGTDDGTGHAGISNCSLLSARALDRSGQGALSDIADAIQWSVDAGADIVNLSLGATSGYYTLRSACDYAANNGVLLVGATGNSGANSVAYPAAYDDVMAVTAVTSNDSLASFSNTGSRVDITAPGTQILSAVPWDDYGRMSGTSMAAPVVSGVAGLVLSAYPDLSGGELRQHLKDTAVDVGLSSYAQGAGRVDAAAAVDTVPDGYDGERGTGDEPQDDEQNDDTDDSDESDGDEEEGHLLAFVTEPDARNAEYEFTADGPVEITDAPYDSPSGRSIGGNGNDTITESDGTYTVSGLTGGGHGDAFRVDGAVTSIDIDQPDVMWVELEGEELSVEEVIRETGGEPDEDENEEADEPTCGDETITASADGTLDGSGWWGESDRYTYSLHTDDPCSATLELAVPDNASFNLYVTLDGRRPSRWDYDESTSGDGEPITVSLEGDEQFGLQVHAVSGSSDYTLSIEERGL